MIVEIELLIYASDLKIYNTFFEHKIDIHGKDPCWDKNLIISYYNYYILYYNQTKNSTV